MNRQRYRSLNSFFRELFGEKVYKLSLSLSDTCPNRDKTAGNRGCIFCSGGSGEFAESADVPVKEQIEKAKKRVEKKGARKFCAYFQSYTSTYCDFDKMRRAFCDAVSFEDVVCLSVATRPDCLPPKTLELLGEINKIKPVFVELGLQTSNDKTAELINRCYKTEVYDDAVKRLHMAGLNVVTHVIIGLPGETSEDILNTVRHVAAVKSDGIKLQLLHVLKNTELAGMYENGEFETLSLPKYAEILERCIELLPKETVVHRITGDGAKKDLIAPDWSRDKKKVLNYINRRFEENNVIQGRNFGG